MTAADASSVPAVLDADGAAEMLRCTRKTIEDRLRSGDLPGEKFGEGWILPTRALLERVNEIAVERMRERRAARDRPPTPALVAVGGARQPRRPPALG